MLKSDAIQQMYKKQLTDCELLMKGLGHSYAGLISKLYKILLGIATQLEM